MNTDTSVVGHLGVIGAGTMGAGIAQVSACAGIQTTLYDISAAVLEQALERIRDSLQRLTRRGKLTDTDVEAAIRRIQTATRLDALGNCDAIIEAAPERLELKRELFVHLDALCPPDVLLASNTSSLSITEIANATRHPERCIGMHFFNPPVIMQLIEIIPGVRSSANATARGLRLAEQLGKIAVEARDTPGFIVNRVIRPFYLEALRLLGDGVADVPTIDRVMKVGGGFPMGPFELIDLVGLDVNFAVSQTVYDSFFHPARFRPHLIQQQMSQAGLLGRKTGRGFYEYVDGKALGQAATEPMRTEIPQPIGIVGEGQLASELRLACETAGLPLVEELARAALVIGASTGPVEVRRLAIRKILEVVPAETEVVVHCGPYSCTELVSMLRTRAAVAGFNVVGPFSEAQLVELAPSNAGRVSAADAGETLFNRLGKKTARVSDSSGMILGRIIAAIANEGFTALHDGLATRADIDTAVKLGANHPRGPLEWAEHMGLETVFQTMRTLQSEYGDAYTPSIRLRRLVQAGSAVAE
ncbi:MAG: 3-hydroxyacyl-CoA dehydrogenase [Chloroflexota bacterium]